MPVEVKVINGGHKPSLDTVKSKPPHCAAAFVPQRAGKSINTNSLAILAITVVLKVFILVYFRIPLDGNVKKLLGKFFS